MLQFIQRYCYRLILFLTMIVGLIFNQATANTVHVFKQWNKINIEGKFPHTKHFLYFLQTILRFSQLGDNIFESNINRAALGYMVNNIVSIWTGYEYAIFHAPVLNRNFYENRAWQQITLRFYQNPHLLLKLRTRQEERFLNNEPGTAWRLRQRFTVTIPKIIDHQLGIIFFDEIFFNLNETRWVSNKTLSQNRAFIGIDLPYSKIVHLHIGYLNQYLRGRRRNLIGNIFYISLRARMF